MGWSDKEVLERNQTVWENPDPLFPFLKIYRGLGGKRVPEGGHVELRESFTDAVIREALENYSFLPSSFFDRLTHRRIFGSLSIVGVEEKEKTNEEGVCGAPHVPSSLVS